MKDNLARNLFKRLAKHLRSIDSDIAIKIYRCKDKQSIRVKYPNDSGWYSWYMGKDIGVDLQLFFFGQKLDNRDELLENSMIYARFESFFDYALSIVEDLDNTTYNLVHSIGNGYKSLEELSIKFDLLGL